ncbi:5-formyltetrahydrofolate cyclo-ligase [Bacillus aerolatus]|uniref:5-formyltetrahydrofolate cyclo-ligase n=1 Tax=Bacillus aerolatus TaxID=2653354 RepID=UPI001CDBC025|nr:5-formyltetrahydrofolate cyclo-ligase [Bacillus aerolatus]
MDKHFVRRQVKEQLANMSKLQYEQFSFRIARRLFSLEEWKKAQTVAVTVSNAPEVDTWQIIRQGWAEGKTMVVPKCVPASRGMNFYELTAFTELETVYSGLYEPDPSCTRLVERGQMDLILVPGLAFSRSGSRLGFGGGYYDRFLMGYKGGTAALAFSQQLLETIPKDPHDLPVAQVITENERIVCRPPF